MLSAAKHLASQVQAILQRANGSEVRNQILRCAQDDMKLEEQDDERSAIPPSRIIHLSSFVAHHTFTLSPLSAALYIAVIALTSFIPSSPGVVISRPCWIARL